MEKKATDGGPLLFSGYRFGEVTVGEERHTKDLLVFQGRVWAPWVRREGHRLALEDLAALLEEGPEGIVVGTGAFGRLVVPSAVVRSLSERGIEILVLDTAKAVEAYNERAGRGERVAAGLHLTC
jgi:hypothetical protein